MWTNVSQLKQFYTQRGDEMQQPVGPPGLKEVNEGKGETGITSNRIHLKIQVMKLNQIEADV